MWHVPLGAICLMRRREELESGKIFPLTTIEELDNGNGESA